MSLLDRLAPRRTDSEAISRASVSPADDTFSTKALRKFLASLTAREAPVLVDLGPVVGSNVSFFGEQLGCKIFVEDLFADVDRHISARTLDALPAFLEGRLHQADGSVDGILCWDLLDYLDRASAQKLAAALTRMLRPQGTLLGFFGTAPPRDATSTKYVIVDDMTLRHRFCATEGRQTALVNRDILRLFPGLHVSDSFLLQNNLREILFRKPAD